MWPSLFLLFGSQTFVNFIWSERNVIDVAKNRTGGLATRIFLARELKLIVNLEEDNRYMFTLFIYPLLN